MRFAFLAALMLLGPVFAQEPAADVLQPARTRLQKALATMASLPSCAFESTWGLDAGAGPKAGAAAQVFMVGGTGSTEPGSVTGSYSASLLHLTCGDSAVAIANRRMIAKGTDGWVVRRGKLADGSALAFVPDPQLFFDLLQGWPLAVTHREVGTLADKPVEILT